MTIIGLFLFLFFVLNVVSFVMASVNLFDLVYHVREKEKRGRKGYIYVFTDVGQLLPVVKIGRANNPEQRLAAHKTAAPFGLFVYCIARVDDDVYTERWLHKRYDRWRVSKKNEWFWMTPVMFYEFMIMRWLFPK